MCAARFFMSRTSIISIVAVTLVAAGTAYWLVAGEAQDVPASSAKRPKVWPKPTEPPPASPNYHEIKESLPSEEDVEREAAEHTAVLEYKIERALLAGNAQDREAAFVYMLPALLQMEPDRVLELMARLEPGDPRNMLRKEVAQLWVHQDTPAATRWMKSLDEPDRRATAIVAVTALAPFEPGQASAMARDFDVGGEEMVRRLLSAAKH
jgi:hypothetical protein